MNAFSQFGRADKEYAASFRPRRQFEPFQIDAIRHPETSCVGKIEVGLKIIPHCLRRANSKVDLPEKIRFIRKCAPNPIQVRLRRLPIWKRAPFVGYNPLGAEQNVHLGNNFESATLRLVQQWAALTQHRIQMSRTTKAAANHRVTKIGIPTQMFAELLR